LLFSINFPASGVVLGLLAVAAEILLVLKRYRKIPGTMDTMLVTYRGVVYPWQCDHMEHLNVAHYVGKFDEATWQMFAAIGVTPVYMREQQCGVAAVQQNISYRRELRAGDLITIRTAILEISKKKIRFYHEMHNDQTGELSAATVITGVHMDIRSRRACPFPNEVVERAMQMIFPITPILS
jgi:acyl-CoA thioester hydrolase